MSLAPTHHASGDAVEAQGAELEATCAVYVIEYGTVHTVTVHVHLNSF